MRDVYTLIPRVSGDLFLSTAFKTYGQWIWDISLDVLYFDSNIFEMYDLLEDHYKEFRIPGTTWYNVNYKAFELLVVEEDKQMIWDGVNKAISSHSPYNLTFKIHTPKGLKYINSHALVGYIKGEPLYMTGVNCDVTEYYKFDIRQKLKR